MAPVCKHHGKPRDTVVSRGALYYVGCVDCKAGVPSKVRPSDSTGQGKQTAKARKSSPSAKPAKFEPSPASKPTKKKTAPDPAPEKKKGGFLAWLNGL